VAATETLRGITGIIEAPDGDIWLNGVGGVTHIEATEIRRALENPAYRAHAERFDYHDGLNGQAPQIRPFPKGGTDESSKRQEVFHDEDAHNRTRTTGSDCHGSHCSLFDSRTRVAEFHGPIPVEGLLEG